MNTGIADAVDLGWKLAAVIGEWGGVRLLASYDARATTHRHKKCDHGRGIHREHEKIDESVAAIEEDSAQGARVRQRVGETLVRGVGRMFRTVGLQIGYRYDDSPICLPDGTPPDPDDPEDLVPSARPGSRAPHLWLGEGRSILDLYGRAFVLLRLGSDPPDPSAFETAAASRGVPLKVVAVAGADAKQLHGRRLVLVRPDGHVAWRANEMPPDAGAIIDKVRGAEA